GPHRPEEQDHPPLGQARHPSKRTAGPTDRFHLHLLPKLEDPDSCYVRRHWDIHCKNVRRSNGIWAPCSGADDAADESMSPQFGISYLTKCRTLACQRLEGVPAFCLDTVQASAIRGVRNRRCDFKQIDREPRGGG